MKKLFGIFLFILLFGSTNVSFGQCILIKDSVLIGTDTGAYNMYLYQNDLLVKIEQYKMSSLNGFDTIYYSGGNITQIDHGYYMSGIPYTQQTTIYIYTSGLLSRLNVSGDNGNGPWTMSHNFYYNGSNQLTDIVLDPTSITGQPEGMVGSFMNITWNSGNVSTVDLVADAGLGLDTFECNLTYDTKLNVGRFVLPSDAGDMMEYLGVNNITAVSLANNETIGTAGTKLLNRILTYYANNEVETQTSLPSVFESDTNATKYYFDCTAGMNYIMYDSGVKLFPNPAAEKIYFSETLDNVLVINALGEICETISHSKSIDISILKPGVYVVKGRNSNGVEISQRVIIE